MVVNTVNLNRKSETTHELSRRESNGFFNEPDEDWNFRKAWVRKKREYSQIYYRGSKVTLTRRLVNATK